MIQSISSWFSWLFSQMDASDWVNAIAIFASTCVGIISIIIAVLTLKQNSKMIEESSRPLLRAATENKELKIISYALQDLCEKHM